MLSVWQQSTDSKLQPVEEEEPMRKLVLSMVVSLDGYIEGPGGEFIPPDWSDDMDRWTFDMIDRFDTLLYGRAAWQQMAAYWPGAETDPATPEPQRRLARFMNSARKIVFSRSMQDASPWAHSAIATAGLAETVAAEKAKPGKDMVIFAGARFAQTAMRAQVIDEYWLLTVPMLFGGGLRLFENHGLRSRLTLDHCRTMDTGAVLTRYLVS
jgi:dihydrofolate reductase